jgi:hypothetical protein
MRSKRETIIDFGFTTWAQAFRPLSKRESVVTLMLSSKLEIVIDFSFTTWAQALRVFQSMKLSSVSWRKPKRMVCHASRPSSLQKLLICYIQALELSGIYVFSHGFIIVRACLVTERDFCKNMKWELGWVGYFDLTTCIIENIVCILQRKTK